MFDCRITEKRCTRYIEGTPNPKWEQAFTFSVEEDELNFHKIKMAAWDYFQPKQNMFIGTATIDLSSEFRPYPNMKSYIPYVYMHVKQNVYTQCIPLSPC